MRHRILACLVTGLICSSAFALIPRHQPSRFDDRAKELPGAVLGVRAMTLEELPAADPLRAGWTAFVAGNGGWAVHLDHRTGMPVLAQGTGIPWLAGPANDIAAVRDVAPLDLLEARARAFLADHSVVLGSWASQLVLDRDASGPFGDNGWVVTFRQVVNGVPVEGARIDFRLVGGNMVSFGASRWAHVDTPARPLLGADEARAAVLDYLGVNGGDVEEIAAPSLRLLPVDPNGVRAGEWAGVRGRGIAHLLVWRTVVQAPGEEQRWQLDVDARLGTVLAMKDTTLYDTAKGGVYPASSDQIPPDGVEQAGLPMPWADISVDGTAGSPTTAHGGYTCGPIGAAVRTTLNGPYVKINDACGAVNEAVLCGGALDLGVGSGTDTNCTVAPGASAGNTRASRTCFYHVNREKERMRYWLPDNAWLKAQVTVNSNVNATCNATWGGALNMYKAGNGCRNTCELKGVFAHELGHGMDENDGGGYDDPTEAYADVVGFFEARASCVGRGFQDSQCGGYGDACLNCTGVRDQDWNQHVSHTPATPQGFATNNCGSGDGPCGKEQHCEAYVSAEAVFDLAYRDLPASGLDADSSWQLAERLWYQSRKGSGGNAYNCTLPNSDGCGATSWYTKLRTADDDDGNLANGTPHAAAIYAAFARHNIACGAATDTTNRNSSGCPTLAATTVALSREGDGLRLDWTAVPNATRYRVFRDDLGCSGAQVAIADVNAPETTYFDASLTSGIDISYRVQGVGSNAACESPVSNCATLSFQPLLGKASFRSPSYGCGATATIEVDDGNATTSTLRVNVWSDVERTPETLTLAATAPGSGTYRGTIALTTAAPTAGDGLLSVTDGAQLSVEYVDADNGSGQVQAAFATAAADCSTLPANTVRVTDITDDSATIRWNTAEATTGVVQWGATTALGSTASDSSFGTAHSVKLTGLAECGRYYFRVQSSDKAGNQATLDAGGTPFAFNLYQIPGFFRDDFEATTGWTLEGEWQINAPQGKGSNNPDPTAAFSGTKVLGHDLTGLGARAGDYEKSINQRASSPTLNATGKSGLEIKFRRWLNTYLQATGYVEYRIGSGTWNVLWQSSTTFGQRESAWSSQTIALPSAVNNAASFQIAFRLNAGSNNTGASSWNVDRVVVRQASDPAAAACGGCGGVPSFGGVTALADQNPCAAGGGVTVTWDAAASWGTGATGTYSVYRDVVPNFTPAAGNRIATGVAATTYADAAAVDGTTYYYLVRAENDQACGGGPANGGAVDTNTVYRSITPASAQSAPGAVAGLQLQQPVGNDLRLLWTGTGDPAYHVYRSASAQTPGPKLADAPAPLYLDAGAASDGATWFYLVRGTNACGTEGP